MSENGTLTEELLRRAAGNDGSAMRRLLDLHRVRLRRMVAARLDKRLVSRVDPSDVVQEALADAGRKMPDYVRDQPLPFYPWLRRLAQFRIIWWHRFHLLATRRSVALERPATRILSDRSSAERVAQTADSGTSPSGGAVAREERDHVRATLELLGERDREMLALRYERDLSFAEIAERLAISLSAAKARHMRALERFRSVLDRSELESQP